MATHKSDQMTSLGKRPVEKLDPTFSGGKVRRHAFQFEVPTGDAARADTIEFLKVPANVRLYGGKVVFEAMTSGDGDAQLKIGDGATANKYLAATSVDAAGEAEFGNTIALNLMEKVTVEFTLTGTVSGAAFAAGKSIYGWVEYIAD